MDDGLRAYFRTNPDPEGNAVAAPARCEVALESLDPLPPLRDGPETRFARSSTGCPFVPKFPRRALSKANRWHGSRSIEDQARDRPILRCRQVKDDGTNTLTWVFLLQINKRFPPQPRAKSSPANLNVFRGNGFAKGATGVDVVCLDSQPCGNLCESAVLREPRFHATSSSFLRFGERLNKTSSGHSTSKRSGVIDLKGESLEVLFGELRFQCPHPPNQQAEDHQHDQSCLSIPDQSQDSFHTGFPRIVPPAHVTEEPDHPLNETGSKP